jgi:hypothetical protein
MVLFTSHCLMSCNSEPEDIDDHHHNQAYHGNIERMILLEHYNLS